MIGKSSPIKARKPTMVKSNSEERLAKLAGGVTVVHVGAPSEAEMKSRKEALEDASAQREGRDGRRNHFGWRLRTAALDSISRPGSGEVRIFSEHSQGGVLTDIGQNHPLEVVYFRPSAAQCYSQPLPELAISSKQLALPVARSLRSLAAGIV